MNKIKLPSIYSQWDERWAKDILGNNSPNTPYNIYNYGCLITCLAMAVEYYGKQETPRDMNEDLKDGGGFYKNTGFYNWGSASRIFSQIKEEKHVVTPYPLSDEQMQEINSALDVGYPVMVQLDSNPKTVEMDMHFVLFIGYNPDNENDYLIADPLGGKEKSLKSYLGWFRPSARKTIESYTILSGKVLNNLELRDMIIDFDDPEGKRRSVFWYVKAWFDQKSDKSEQKRYFELKLLEKDKAFSKNNLLLDEAVKEITRKEHKIQKLNSEIVELKSKNSRLIDQNASLYEVVDLIKMVLTKISLLPKKK